MMVSSWLRQRVNFTDVYNMDLGIFHYLHVLVLNEQRSEEGKKNKSNEIMSDELENMMT